DLRWFLRTCHACQVRSTEKVVIPPSISTPATLFRRVHIDTMYMPKVQGYQFIIQGRCSLSRWPEWRMLKSETGRTVGQFIFEEILCRWVSHRYIRDGLVKACGGDIRKWVSVAPYIFWADRITTRRDTGYSPYYIAHGVEPLLPFDITQATFLLPEIIRKLSDDDLIALRAQQLQRREEDLARIHERVIQSRFRSIEAFRKHHKNVIHDYKFNPGDLVLVLNKRIEKGVSKKALPRYFGPMVVAKRTEGGNYRLAEVTGAISKLRYAAFRIIPYYARSSKRLDVTEFLDPRALAGIEDDGDDDREEADEDSRDSIKHRLRPRTVDS
ncbi:hypothetical protein GG344DRAFT_59739, partial [Lentinula edodes]